MDKNLLTKRKTIFLIMIVLPLFMLILFFEYYIYNNYLQYKEEKHFTKTVLMSITHMTNLLISLQKYGKKEKN